jgi:radical SAM/Cys-rich protein
MPATLKMMDHPLADAEEQLRVIDGYPVPRFESMLEESGLHPLEAIGIDTLQINVGKLCNQTCKHCHVDAGPDRTEIMTRETMQNCLDALDRCAEIKNVDLTGGAPEMNPDFRWFVEQIRSRKRHVMVRSNLTILVVGKYRDMPEFFRDNEVEVVSSLPYYLADQTDAQRGDGVFEKSIEALKRLNELGFGMKDSDLKLNLVYNPVGAFLPPAQGGIENDYRRELRARHGIEFNSLYTITNMPISRFLEFLVRSGNYDRYMRKLHATYNPTAAAGVMCRTTLSVGWDGRLYDCDFNQMLDLMTNHGAPTHIRDFDASALVTRQIVTRQHCYGCTAGAGSSCAGEIA